MVFLSNNRTSNFCSVFSGCLFSLVSLYYSHLFKSMFLVIRVPCSIFIEKTPEQYKQSGRCPGLHLTLTTPQRELLFSGQWSSSRALLSVTTYMPSAFFSRSRVTSWETTEPQSWYPGHWGTARVLVLPAAAAQPRCGYALPLHRPDPPPPPWASGMPCVLSCKQHCSQSPREVSAHVRL